MQNIGEEITGQYLRLCRHCEFIEYNLQTIDIQGKIDVVGINIEKRQIYFCEVATHLETGLQYTKNARPVNVDRLTHKFSKDIEYARKYFPDYELIVMLWSPIVKNAKDGSLNNQITDVEQIKQQINNKYGIKIIAIINNEYLKALNELRAIASITTEELKSPVMRYLQIEEKLKKHVEKINKKNISIN